MADRELTAKIRFGLDKREIDRSKDRLEDFEDQLERLERRGGSVRQEWVRTWTAYRRGVVDATEATRRLERQMEALESHQDRVRNFAGYFGDIAGTLAIMGAGIGGPLILAANSYVQAAQGATDISREWLAITSDISDNQQRIGAVVASELLPVLRVAADVTERVAAFVERNPQAVRLGLGVGGALLATATLLEATERGIRLVMDARSIAATATQLAAARIMDTAANKQLAAAGGMARGGGAGGGLLGAGLLTGSAIVGGLGAGLGINELFSGFSADLRGTGIGFLSRFGIRDIGFAPLSQYATVAAHLLGGGSLSGTPGPGFMGGLFSGGGAPADRQLAQFNPGGVGAAAVAGAGSMAADFARRRSMVEQFNRERAQIIETHGQRIADATERHEQRRAGLIERHALRQAEATERYQLNQRRTLEQAQLADQRAQEQYLANRQAIVENANRATQQAEANHQKSMERLREDHQVRLEDAVRNQDAIAFLREQRSFDQQRERAEEDFNDRLQLQDEATALQLRQLEEGYQRERRIRQENLDIRLRDMEAAYNRERERQNEALQRSLAEEAEIKQQAYSEFNAWLREEMATLVGRPGAPAAPSSLTRVNNGTLNTTFNFSERDDSRAILSQVDRLMDEKMLMFSRGF